jgi:hypothetical protein
MILTEKCALCNRGDLVICASKHGPGGIKGCSDKDLMILLTPLLVVTARQAGSPFGEYSQQVTIQSRVLSAQVLQAEPYAQHSRAALLASIFASQIMRSS